EYPVQSTKRLRISPFSRHELDRYSGIVRASSSRRLNSLIFCLILVLQMLKQQLVRFDLRQQVVNSTIQSEAMRLCRNQSFQTVACIRSYWPSKRCTSRSTHG